MITLKTFFTKALAAGLLLLTPLIAVFADQPAAKPANAKDAYPLKECVVSEEPLGSMGEPYRYTYKVAGQPDREVRFCCSGCVKDFKKNPAAYLKKIDDAVAADQVAQSSTKKG